MIQQKLELILSRYAQARLEPFSGTHEIQNVFGEIVTALSEMDFVRTRSYLKVKFGVGKGNWARVPWIAILDHGETIQNGVYCTFLFRQDMSGVYITFNQGVTEIIKQNGKVKAYRELKKRVEAIHKFCSGLPSKGFTLGAGIDLRVDSGLGADYEHSTIAHKFYESGRVPADTEIYSDVEATLMAYDSYLKGKNPIVKPIINPPVPNEKKSQTLPKPFLLLAGISGTGKTRFVREQAIASAARYGLENGYNYCLVPVRPDWHEPSDLLGYISRIGEGGARYVVTDLLCFIVKVWKHAVKNASAKGVDYKELNSICPFWLCLDEMNLAPVEQYFADYLSILETRKWVDGVYSCDPLLKPAVIQKQLDENGQTDLWKKLGIDDEDSAGLRAFFTENGIPLPLNLIVAGTVNMDETTHGFSRKVIDRALTIDFGEFFTNDYSQYYEVDKKTTPRTLGFPRLSGVHDEAAMAAVAADPDGRKTIAFLGAVNGMLEDTPFQLAFRALNEILLSVVCFSPADEVHLQAVWDDFLMMKVLPRIEGDSEKLRYDGDGTGLLVQLTALLTKELPAIAVARPDLLRTAPDDSEAETTCRSLKKLAWMQQRLENNSFTTFWP